MTRLAGLLRRVPAGELCDEPATNDGRHTEQAGCEQSD